MTAGTGDTLEATLRALDEETAREHAPEAPVPEVSAYGELLDRLAAKCPEGRDEIGEIAGATRDLLREEGLHVFARTILVSADEFFKDEDTAAKYDMTFGDLARTVVGRMLSGD